MHVTILPSLFALLPTADASHLTELLGEDVPLAGPSNTAPWERISSAATGFRLETLTLKPTGGYSFLGGEPDCEDGIMMPNTQEICDGIDNNCNGVIDEGLTVNIYYADEDRDGYGDWDKRAFLCTQPEGYIADASDCDDTDAAIPPLAPERCNALDDDCDGIEDDNLADVDGSGLADCWEVAVVLPQGAVRQSRASTCGETTALDAELTAMEEALAEQGLALVAITEDAYDGVSYVAIAPYSVVVYHTLGRTEPAVARTTRSLVRAAGAGAGIVMMGHHLAQSAESRTASPRAASPSPSASTPLTSARCPMRKAQTTSAPSSRMPSGGSAATDIRTRRTDRSSSPPRRLRWPCLLL